MKANKIAEHFSFDSGFIQDSNTIRIIARLDEMTALDEPNTTFVKWDRLEATAQSFSVDWYAANMWVHNNPDVEVIAVGPDGRVIVGGVSESYEEVIDDSDDGPPMTGLIRDFTLIGEHFYAAGMGRMVYRREARGNWVRRDGGIVQDPTSLEVKGFNSIDGLSERDIYAVGFDGEIWNYRKKWQQIDSPTNVILNRVRAIDEDRIYACGQNGLLLCGAGNDWEVVEHEATKEELWDIVEYNGDLYVSADENLYTLNNNFELQEVDLGLDDSMTFGRLYASDGLLLSVGDKNVCWTLDGRVWNDFTTCELAD